MIAATFGPGQVAYSLLWFFLFVIEIWLMIMIFTDVFRSHDLSGWAKAAWVLLVLVIPLIGILAYLIFRGDKMRAHEMQRAEQQQEWLRRYLQDTLGVTGSPAQELSQLAALRDRGDISADEYLRLKAQVIDRHTTAA